VRGVEHIDHGHDAATEGDALAFEAVWVAGAVPAFVVGEGDLAAQLQDRDRTVGQDVAADQGVGFDVLEFLWRELGRFEQDDVGDADLADVVQRRGLAQPADLFLGQPEGRAQQA
jgi:hypothetical protein